MPALITSPCWICPASLQVTGPDNSYDTGKIFEAFNYAIKMGAHIISCSFGPAGFPLKLSPSAQGTVLNETKFYGDAISAAAKANIFVAAASGACNNAIFLCSQVVPHDQRIDPRRSPPPSRICKLVLTSYCMYVS